MIKTAAKRVSRRRFLRLAGMSGTWLTLGKLCGAEARGSYAARWKPNILVIFVDDIGYGELGCQGNPQIPTPHIDSLAGNGVRFTNGYVTASYCSPSRAGLLTGRYQTRFGHELNPTGRHNLDPRAGLPLSELTLAKHLKKAGYATGLIGKWHLGGTEKFHPLHHGFDGFFGFLHEGHFYVPPPYRNTVSFLRKKTLPPECGGREIQCNIIWSSHVGRDEPPYDEKNPLLRGTQPVREDTHLTDAFTREAVAFIDRHRKQPFSLYLAYNAVHSPMQSATKYLERFKHIDDIHRRVFAGMLANLDDGVGTVLDKLREHSLEENTLIFFLSDNGGPTAELTSHNGPLRGGKGSLYEGGIRIPFLVQWKGTLPAGRTYDRPVISTDIFATASAAAGLDPPRDRKLDGVDLIPYLTGRTVEVPHDCLFWRMGRRGALRKGGWKIVREAGRGHGEPRVELYDLNSDAGETRDLALERPDKLRELLSHWENLNAEMVEPVWTPRKL